MSQDNNDQNELQTVSSEDGWELLSGGGIVRYGTEGVLACAPPHIYLARGTNIQRYNLRDDTWESFDGAMRLPHRIGPGADMAYDGSRHVYVTLGDDSRTFCRFNTEAHGVRRITSAPSRVGVGGRLAYGDGSVYALRGRETCDSWLYEIERERWANVPRLPGDSSPPIGHVSSGLFHADGLVYACPDHRVLWYDGLSASWREYARLGFRPSVDGGMHALDEQEQKLYVIQGMASRTLGVLDLKARRFRHLRPRLPDVVSVEGERALVAEVDGDRYLYVYRGHDTDEFWRIRLDALTEVGGTK